MIVVSRDAEGLRLVLAEMLERDHGLRRLGPQLEGKTPEEQARRMRSVARITISPGYERWAQHLILLERLHKLGIALGELLAVEVSGLQVLANARIAHRNKHPECFACGMPQDNKFQTQCLDCGTAYSKRGR